jgi:hypothetical protein
MLPGHRGSSPETSSMLRTCQICVLREYRSLICARLEYALPLCFLISPPKHSVKAKNMAGICALFFTSACSHIKPSVLPLVMDFCSRYSTGLMMKLSLGTRKNIYL